MRSKTASFTIVKMKNDSLDVKNLLAAALDNFSRPPAGIKPLTGREDLCVVKRNLLRFNRILYEF